MEFKEKNMGVDIKNVGIAGFMKIIGYYLIGVVEFLILT